MTKRNSIPLGNYFFKLRDIAWRNRIVKWIKEAGALTSVNGKELLDIPKFDDFILKNLDEERSLIKENSDFRSASLHIAKAFDLFDARLLYLAWLKDKCLYDKNAESAKLKRRFKADSQNFGELADRLILAYELFFDAEPSKMEISKARATIDENRSYV